MQSQVQHITLPRQQNIANLEQHKPRKNKYQFNLQRGRVIRIQSDFDSGNIGLIRQVTQLQYRLQAVSDFKISQTLTPKKTWFHFRVSAPRNIRIRLIIENVSIYENMYEDNDWARPVMNDGSGWKQIKQCFLTYRGQVGIIIDHTFAAQNFVYFAMAVPHSYEQSQKYLKELSFRIPEHIQYEDEVVCKSYGGLNLHLLKLTAKQPKNKEGNSSSGNLLPSKQTPNQIKGSSRVYSEANIQNTISSNYVSTKKPIIFITSRVHPGEVGSSHCLIGILDFLTRSSSLQAYLLLKMFQVMIIPIVNPDGVYEGNYRMDLHNTNLNRVYLQPSPDLQPTVYKIKQIISNLVSPTNINSKQKLANLFSRKIMFHFDLHSHSSIKSAFIYGNAFDQIVTQTQSELYCKLLQQNCQFFKYGLSQFGQKHMKMKDKGQALTKEGCARVVISKMANVTYSYTVQTAIFPYLNKESLMPINNSQFKFLDKFQYENVKMEELIDRYGIKNQLFLDNVMLGYGLMVTILDLLQKNPYTRIPNLQQSLESYRKQISQNLLQSQQRFKLLDMKAYQKVKNISKCCKQQFTSKNQKIWTSLANNKNFTQANWPCCFKMFQINNNYSAEPENQKKRNRTKTQVSDFQRQVNDFIYPKNIKKKLLNLQTQVLKNEQIQRKITNQQVSPSKSMVSARNVHIQLELHPITKPTNSSHQDNTPIFPQIRSIQRNSLHSKKGNSYSLSKYQACAPQIEQKNNMKMQIKQLRQMKQLKQIKQLNQKETTKNIVLSFIHDEIQKINTIRKNVQKSIAVQNRLASYKLNKKSSRSSKQLNPIGSVIGAANRYGIILSGNGVVGHLSNNSSMQNSQLLSHSKSKKKIMPSIQTCEQVVNRRKNLTIQENQQQKQYEEQQGIYYVQNDKNNQRQGQIQAQGRVSEQKPVQIPKSKKYMPGSLQKISQYPLYPSHQRQRQKDPAFMSFINKRQLAKIKFSEIKKKNNIIRQDLNHSIKLPQLKCIGSNHAINSNLMLNNATSQEQQANKNYKNVSAGGHKNGLSINVNVNLNLNVCIDSNQVSGRARAATMPDDL